MFRAFALQIILFSSLVLSSFFLEAAEEAGRSRATRVRRPTSSTTDAPDDTSKRSRVTFETEKQHIRNHFITGAIQLSSSKIDGISGTKTQLGLLIDYIYDLGYFGFGPRIGFAGFEESKQNSISTEFGLLLRINFNENRIGNNFIPNLILASGGLSTEISDTTTGKDTTRETYTSLSLGVDVYPFSNYLALTPALTYRQETDDFQNKTTKILLGMGLAASF